MWNESFISGSTGQLFYCLHWAKRHIQNLEETKKNIQLISSLEETKQIYFALPPDSHDLEAARGGRHGWAWPLEVDEWPPLGAEEGPRRRGRRVENHVEWVWEAQSDPLIQNVIILLSWILWNRVNRCTWKSTWKVSTPTIISTYKLCFLPRGQFSTDVYPVPSD